MIQWRTSLKRKKHQQSVNKVIRMMNKNLRNDPAWFGRFEIRQIHSEFYVFEDKSGAYLIVFLEIVDKKTRKARMVHIEEGQFFDWHVWEAVNRFITEDIHTSAWNEPVEDFRNVEIPVHSLRWWRNYWHQVVEV